MPRWTCPIRDDLPLERARRAEAIGDHYAAHFPPPVARTVYGWSIETDPEGTDGGIPVTILSFDGVLEGCRVHASLGFGAYDGLDAPVEALIAADDAPEDVANLLASTLVSVVQGRYDFGPGFLMTGLDSIAPCFCRRFGFSALYFTGLQFGDPGLGLVKMGDSTGVVLQGIFLTPEEEAFKVEKGWSALEEAFSAAGMDPFTLRRSPVV